MRRLLPLAVALTLAMALPASAPARQRVPSGVKQIAVTLTFPPRAGGTRRPLRRTLKAPATVRRVVTAVNALSVAQPRGTMCPMFRILGPELTVVFRAGPAGPALAEAQVQVALGTRGDSGSSVCFPIRYSAGGRQQSLVGNSFVRLMGRLIGTAIS